jgi:hypothetical protein
MIARNIYENRKKSSLKPNGAWEISHALFSLQENSSCKEKCSAWM